MQVYIIDYEPKIRRGLANIISSYRPSWPAPLTAGNAETAWNDPAFLSTDLLFLDIQLPGMSGLDLLERTQSLRKSTMQVVIISGYAEFSFAQKAIQMQVSDYLLKPIALKKVYDIVDAAEILYAKQREDASTKATVLQNLGRVQRHFFADTLFGKDLISPGELRGKLTELQLRDSPFLLLLCYGPEAVLKEQFTAWLSDYLTAVGSHYLLQRGERCVALLLDSQPSLQDISSRIKEDVRPLTLGISSVHASLAELSIAMQEANAYAKGNTQYQEGLIQDQTLYIEEVIQKQKQYHLSVQRVISYITANYSEELGLTDVSDFVHLNKNYLSALFKQETGVNLSNFITDYRIFSAKKALRANSAKITAVARAVGFKDDHYFSQVFSRRVGLTPKKYRILFSRGDLHPQEKEE